MAAVECFLCDAEGNENGSTITVTNSAGIEEEKQVNGNTKSWKVAEEISKDEFRMAEQPFRHQYVFPRIQEYIAAVKRKPQCDATRAQRHGRKAENKGAEHRLLK